MPLNLKRQERADTPFIETEENVEDDAVVSTGLGIKVTNNGQLFMIVVRNDISCDGSLSAEDARIALRASVGLESINDAQCLAGDTDGDGKLTAGDARILLRLSVGLE